jgi:hypothetical protein
MDGDTAFDTALTVLKIVGKPGPIQFSTRVYYHSWDWQQKIDEDYIVVGAADKMITAEDIEAVFALVTQRVAECNDRTYWFEGLKLDGNVCEFLWGT